MKLLPACLGLLLGSIWATGQAAAPEPVTGEIVFTRFDGHQTDLYRMAADDPKPVLIYRGSDPTNGSAMAPHWSADLQRILFTARRDGRWQLVSTDRDGRDLRPEPGASAFDAPPPAGGTKEAAGLSLSAGDLYYAPPGGTKVKLYDYRAAAPKPMPEDPGGAQDASWGPGHRWVIFSSCGERRFAKDTEPCHLHIVTPDGRNRKDLGPGEAPDWRAGGS